MTALIPSGSWLGNVVDAGARSLLMAAAVGLGLKLLRVGNVMARKVAWTLVLCAAMVMPAIAPWAENQSWFPMRAVEVPLQTLSARLARLTRTEGTEPPVPVHHYPMRVEAATSVSARPATLDPPASPLASKGDHYPAPAIALDGVNRPARNFDSSSRAGRKLSWGEWGFLAYCAVGFMLLVRIGVGGIAAARLWMRAKPVSGIIPPSDLEGRVRWTREISSPVTVGSGILLPEDYRWWDAEKLRIVLAHEGSHVRQGDFYLQLGAALYGAAFWFSPLGWWLKRTLCDLSEAISDRAAVGEAATHASYAQVLLDFAAMPRTTRIGVAMAREGRLSHRIHRLLDESSFRRAFSGGRGRIAIAALLAPLALIAATSIRVQAAGQEPPAPPVAPSIPAPPTPAAPATAAIPQAPSEPPAAGEAPVAPEAPEPPPAAPDAMDAAPVAPGPPSQLGRVGPPPGTRIVGGESIGSRDSYSYASSQSNDTSGHSHDSSSCTTSDGEHFSCSYADRDGDSYALVRGNGNDHVSFSGDWTWNRRAEIDKAHKIAHGDFLWFTRGGKSFVVDDPAIISGLLDLYKPMEDLGRQQEELGRQQEELGRQQEKLGEQMHEASIPTPDVSKEMAALNAAAAELNTAKGKTVTQDQLADLQEKLAELQGRLGSLQGEVGSRQGEIGRRQGELGAKQGELGSQQGRLGAEQGRIAREADRKVKAIIEESLRNGKARPVE